MNNFSFGSYNFRFRILFFGILILGLRSASIARAGGDETTQSTIVNAVPVIQFTHVPLYGTLNDPNGVADRVSGIVENIVPSEYYVVCYTKVGTKWWIKPYDYAHFWETSISKTGKWQCDIWTGGVDQKATIVEAYLVSKLKVSANKPTRDWLLLHSDAKVEVSRVGAPVVISVLRANPNPTSATNVNFKVNFSKPVTGVSSVSPFSDFALVENTGASITSVTGTGSTYTVTVESGSGIGSIRLDVVDDNTIVDAVNNPLGGPEIWDGDFIDGQTYSIVDSEVVISTAGSDGWILESLETSDLGGKLDEAATTINIGDNAVNKQYRSILSFDTSALPDDALITSITLKFKYAGKTGTLPFGTHGNLLVDVIKGAFSGDQILQLSDFNATSTSDLYKAKVLTYTNSTIGGWYSKSFSSTNFGLINLASVTQFRLRFAIDDNNDFGADVLKIYSGNADLANQPQLIIEYYVP